MAEREFHSSDQQLLLYADGELKPHDVARVRAHLEACWECRARLGEIERTIADFVQVHRQARESNADAAGPRALLKARLAELARSSHNSRWRAIGFALNTRTMSMRTLAYACGLALLLSVSAGVSLLYQRAGARASSPIALLPNPSLTPGSTRQVSLAVLCASDHDEVIRTVPVALQKRVLAEYGIKDVSATNDYELDYLITPGLGGSDDVRNLWPEPHSHVWNSYVKDQLEDHLHQMVCDGQLSLPEAQKEIADNWISAYKKYFHTDQPLLSTSPSNISRDRWPPRQRTLARLLPGPSQEPFRDLAFLIRYNLHVFG